MGLRDFILGVQIIVLAQYDYGPLPVHFVGKTATAMIMTDIPVLMISGMGQSWIFNALENFGVALAIWGVALYWVAGVIYIKQGMRLIRQAHEEKRDGE